MAESTKIDDIRMLVEVACKHGAPIDIVFEHDGDVRVNIYPNEQKVEMVLDCNETIGDAHANRND